MNIMKKGIIYSLFIGLLALASCSPRVTTTLIKAKAPLEEGEEVTVLQPEDPELAHALVIETFKASGKEYEPMVEIATDKAREAGANVLRIVNRRSPDIASPKHRFTAVAYWADDSVKADSTAVTLDQLGYELNIRPLSSGWHFAVQGGAVYRLGTIPSTSGKVEEQHYKNMRWGYSYGADASYFLHENLGIGVKFLNFHSEDSMPVSAINKNGSTVYGVSEDKVDIYFIGPVVTFRLPSRDRRNAFMARFGAGYDGYYDKGIALNVKGTIKSKTLGLLYEVGYDFGISKHLSAGASLTFVASFLKGMDVTIGKDSGHVELSENNNISHLGLNIGLRYNI